MAIYEIEIKTLLGTKENADQLVEKMKQDPSFQEIGSHKQLNHYFTGGNLSDLFMNVSDYLPVEKHDELDQIIQHVQDFSVRTREADGDVILVVKASLDAATSFNGVARQEFEARIKNISLDRLDQMVIESGFSYQAKWSRERSDYKYKTLNVSIDKNAGYGYLAEFESLIEDENDSESTQRKIKEIMNSLGVAELPQDRLGRMFDYYNEHWQDYYGTEKTFAVE